MAASAILAGKTTANIDIFPQITRFLRSPDAALRNIDENGALPYKPRQLSAMPGLTGAAHLGRKRSMFGASI